MAGFDSFWVVMGMIMLDEPLFHISVRQARKNPGANDRHSG